VVVNAKAALFDSPEVTALIRSLQESTRATPTAAGDRYVPVAGAEVASADYHHFVFGQRGAGKSSLLRHLEQVSKSEGRLTVWIDQEIFSNLEYPDVLVSAVDLVFQAAAAAVIAKDEAARKTQTWWQRLLRRDTDHTALRRGITGMAAELQRLKFAPIDRKIEWVQSDSTSQKAGLNAGPALPHLEVRASVEKSTARERQSKETVQGTKDQYLERALVDLRRALLQVSTLLGGGLIFVDDLYQIRRSDQALVLGYLHRLVKDTNTWLKIGSIRYSTEPFVGGDPPRGMQSGHDAHEIALDRGMRHFESTRRFLEEILGNLCQQSGVNMTDLFTEDARKRLVLSAGGVARDYLRIASGAILEARNRGVSEKTGSHRVTVEDVNKGAGTLAPSKRKDLRRDEPAEADELDTLVQELTEFCRTKKSAYFLVATDDVNLSRQVDKLQHLRFAHLLIESETIPDQGSKRFNVWLLDVAELSAQRATVGMDFLGWENRSKRRNRSLIFRP